jgi:hypothetical protein
VPSPARPVLSGRPSDHPRDAIPGLTKEIATTRPAPTTNDTPTDRAPRRHALLGRLPTRRLVVATLPAAALVVALASPAYAAGGAPTLNGVIDNLRNWLVGILAGVATLFLTIGGLRYLTAGGDPGQVEKAKTALKSAAIGYALAILAPLLVSILASVVGGQ